MPELQVVAGHAQSAVASHGEETGDMGLVGEFVGGESEVAVDAVDTLFGLQVAQGGVEGCKGVDEGLGELEELVVDGSPPGFVGVEPLAVVVDRQFFEKGEGVGVDVHINRSVLQVRWGALSVMVKWQSVVKK